MVDEFESRSQEAPVVDQNLGSISWEQPATKIIDNILSGIIDESDIERRIYEKFGTRRIAAIKSGAVEFTLPPRRRNKTPH
jgi:CBS domain-containing protein